VSGNEHGVSPEIGAIAANDNGESDEGESESENGNMESGEENKCEEEIGEGEKGHESTGISKPCKPNISEGEIHDRTYLLFRNWREVCIEGRAQDVPHKLKEKEEIGMLIAYKLWVHEG
jgi:hypothetical protein